MAGYDSGTYERCRKMNQTDGKECNKKKHISHKKHWIGGWYGLLSHKDPRDQGYGKNKPRPTGPKKKDSKGIWRFW
jgi:hypothetical protein